MDALIGGAKAPGTFARTKSRAITRYSASVIVGRESECVYVNPDFDEETYTKSTRGDTVWSLAKTGAGI